MFWLGYWISYLAPALTVLSFSSAHVSPLWVLVLAFFLIPLLDEIGGDDELNPSPATEAQWEKQGRYNLILYAFVPVQWALLLWACQLAAQPGLSALNWSFLLLLVGVVNGGLSINMAHELCHRNSALEQFLAKALWFRVGYLHFHIEHVQGHHPRMCTPDDPATARLGESVYRFYLRCIPQSWRSAWRIERRRLKCLRLPVFSWRNQMLWFTALPVLLCAAVYSVWGGAAALFYLAQAGLAILTLETINYIEHYGLMRQQLPSGRYEKIGVQHAWNSHRRLSNFFLLKLQRHSDHHMNAQRKYPILRSFAQSPRLPLGYGSMFLIALIPPLWHGLMDARAEAHRVERAERTQGEYQSSPQSPGVQSERGQFPERDYLASNPS